MHAHTLRQIPRPFRITILTLACLTIGYLVMQFTSVGRLTGLYVVGGWHAPLHVRTACVRESTNRVGTLFTKPLAMDAAARQGLREYWHYSYFRECLFRAGYTFLGAPLERSSMDTSEEGSTVYRNPIAGIVLTFPSSSTELSDNVLDVTFDARLLRSTFVVGSSTVTLDTYMSHDNIHSFDDILTYLDHFPANDASIVAHNTSSTISHLPYLSVTQDDGVCGTITYTPHERIVHLYTTCTKSDLLLSLTNSLSITERAQSIH